MLCSGISVFKYRLSCNFISRNGKCLIGYYLISGLCQSFGVFGYLQYDETYCIHCSEWKIVSTRNYTSVYTRQHRQWIQRRTIDQEKRANTRCVTDKVIISDGVSHVEKYAKCMNFYSRASPIR